MLPWSIGGVTDLPANAKLGKMQQNTDRLVQLIGAATPDVPNQKGPLKGHWWDAGQKRCPARAWLTLTLTLTLPRGTQAQSDPRLLPSTTTLVVWMLLHRFHARLGVRGSKLVTLAIMLPSAGPDVLP